VGRDEVVAAASRAAVSSGGRRGLGVAADDGSDDDVGTGMDMRGTAGRGGNATDST